jgi:uncharacterized phage protein gp47/JayE
MALETPTTKEIKDSIINQVVASTSPVTTLLPLAFTRFFSKVLAGVFMLIYKYAGWMFLQIFVRTASFEETVVLGQRIRPLVEWGRLIGVGDPTPATQAELLLDITVTNQTGSLPAGTQAVSNKNGITYILLAPVTLDAALKQGTFRAASDVDGGTGGGTIGNLEPGDIVSFVNPLANVERDTIVDSVTTTGADAETEPVYRQRVIDRFQQQPQGGAGVDYVIWGTDVEGVIGIFPYTGDHGFVDVYVEVNTSIDPDGIAPQDILDDVSNSIIYEEGAQTRKPINAFLNTFSITRRGFDIAVSGLNVSDPATVEPLIEDAINTYFLDRQPFIDGVIPLPRRDRIQLSNVRSIVDSFASAAGGSFGDVNIFFTGTTTEIPDGVYSLQIGEKSKATTISF